MKNWQALIIGFLGISIPIICVIYFLGWNKGKQLRETE